MKSILLGLLAGFMASGTLFPLTSKAATLGVGDKAPALETGEWIQGEPVKSFAKRTTYIVEFWATWCGPCKVSIPHLNELHEKFKSKGLVVIGQDVWENDVSRVKPFVKQMGNKMTYRVALDKVVGDEKGAMAKNWMEAADQNGIPAAFVVNGDGVIVWLGHPMQLKEKTVEEVLSGKFDLAKEIQRRKAEEQTRGLWEDYRAAAEKEDWSQAEGLLEKIEGLLPEDGRGSVGMTRVGMYLDRGEFEKAHTAALKAVDQVKDQPMAQNGLAWNMVTREGLRPADLELAEKIIKGANEGTKGENAEILDTYARILFVKGDKQQAIALQEKAVKFSEGPRKTKFAEVLADYKAGRVPNDAHVRTLELNLDRHLRKQNYGEALRVIEEYEAAVPPSQKLRTQRRKLDILYKAKNIAAADKLAERIAEENSSNSMLQNDIAWDILVREDLQDRNIDLAERIARKANTAAKEAEPEILDTLARALFMNGKKTEAVAMQDKAVALAKGERKKQFQSALDSYKAGKLPKAY